MKTILLTLSMAFLGFTCVAQDIEIYHEGTTVDISGTTVQGSGDLTEMKYYMDVKNNTNTSIYLKVTRLKIEEVAGALDYFCWGSNELNGTCYSSDDVTPSNPWTSVDSFNYPPGNVGILWSYHNPEGDQSVAVYRYYLTHNGIALDSVDVQYNYPLSVKPEKATTINVFPNPANNVLNVNIENLSGNATIGIYDISGKEISTTAISNGKNQLNIENSIAGLYFYTILHNGEAIEVKKLIIF